MVVTMALPPFDSCRSSCNRCMAVVLSRPCKQRHSSETVQSSLNLQATQVPLSAECSQF